MKLRHPFSIVAAVGLTFVTASCSDDESTTDDSVTRASERPTATAESPAATDSAATDPVATDPAGSSPSTSEQDLDERADAIGDALADGDFTTMLDLLELSGLSDELEGREITVLAPSEAAFSDLTADELGELIADRDRAEDLLRRHILDGLYTYDALAELDEVTTISDEVLPVTSTGDSVTVAGAAVTAPDADALAGEEGQEVAVFGIDRLLSDDQ